MQGPGERIGPNWRNEALDTGKTEGLRGGK